MTPQEIGSLKANLVKANLFPNVKDAVLAKIITPNEARILLGVDTPHPNQTKETK